MIGELMAMSRSVGSGVTYVDDVFSTYLYTGNGSTQTITNGIDLAGKGGLVWIKQRGGVDSHQLRDTARGGNWLSTNSTIAEQASSTTDGTITSYNSNGFTLGTSGGNQTPNGNNFIFASWTFRKAPKFFDVVTYTGDNTTRNISHALGTTPGMIVVKRTDAASTQGWVVWHTSTGGTNNLLLNSTAAAAALVNGRISAATSTTFTVQAGSTNNADVNATGGTYVAYLFAHDTTTDGIIQCGITDASGNATLGWEPQFVLIKQPNVVDNWVLLDTMRGWINGGTDSYLFANASNAEASNGGLGNPTATGFTLGGGPYIYLAIRRPNKPPTTGTQVYNAIARTGTGAAVTTTAAGFAPDLVFTKKRSSTTLTGARFVDRLRGKTNWLDSSATAGETSTADTVTGLDVMTGFVLGADATTSAFNTNTHTYVDEYFRRAPGVFDVVCWTGDNTYSKNHSLGVVPEMVITKARSITSAWYVGFPSMAKAMYLNTTDAWADSVNAATTTTFTPYIDSIGTTVVAYLFATKAGISKCFSFTGNGSSQTINCGFSAGARFVLIKRTDSTGDWFVWDSVRGIVAANDPHLSLNTTAAEVTTDDSIDPDNSGFIVNQVAATNINVNAATYIGIAFA